MARGRRVAKTVEARENQLIALAIDEAEKRIRDGTASSQLLSHFLRLGTTRERLEKTKLERETELLTAKTESIKSAARVEELYENAMKALGIYQGARSADDEEL